MSHPDPVTPAAFPATLFLTVNGERRSFPAPLTCAGLVEALALGGRRIAFERNGEIVPRSRLADTALADADTVEIVVAVGGG
jgi:sulfur carrier protein